MSPIDKRQCPLFDTFTLGQKWLMRFLWYGFIGIGAAAILVSSLIWGAIYLLFTALGFALVVLPVICSRCPYPYQYDTCLFLPPEVIRRFSSPKQSPITAKGIVATVICLVIIIGVPQYWLWGNRLLLIIFWLFCLPGLLAFPVFYCKRCRHSGCPMNNAQPEGLLKKVSEQ